MKDFQTALISNPVSGPDEPKDRWVRVGERLGDLNVLEITKDSILLKDNKETYSILLYDKNKAKRISAVRSDEQPTVVITQPEKKQEKPVTKKADKKQSDKYETVSTPFGTFKRTKRK